jgi:predicted metal-dependent hydrolase
MLRRALTSDNPIIVGDFTVLVKPVARARNLTLRYNLKKACFVVTGPKRASRKSLVEFVSQQQHWMQQQLKTMPKPPSIIEDGFVMLEGRPRKIVHQIAAGVKIILDDDALIIHCREERLQRAIKRFVIQHAEKTITPLTYEKAALSGKKFADITFRDTSSRWGSCTHDGRLSFSWRLIMAPMETIDYVVAHEVAHLTHFDHSPKFWGLCRELSAHFTAGKHWLKINGAHLQGTIL